MNSLLDSITTTVLYVIALILFIYYCCYKYKKRKYLFSIFNITYFMYAFMMFVISLALFNSDAWIKLLGETSSVVYSFYLPYLIDVLSINYIGFIVFTLSLRYFEFDNKRSGFVYRITGYFDKIRMKTLIDIEYLFIVIVWFLLMIIFNNGFPIFGMLTQDSIVTTNQAAYFISSALFFIISMMTVYYGISIINHHHKYMYFIIGLIACILMGKRSWLFIDIIFTLFLYRMYLRNKTIGLRSIFKVICFCGVLIIVALELKNMLLSSYDLSLFENILYGNTFSDLRDGTFVYYGFINNFNSEYLLGKSYLSGLISFIPSSLSDFRLQWDYGRFSTYVLFGWEGHPGLRGGWSMENYLNFAMPGVIVMQFVLGWIFASLEKYFYNEVILEKNIISEKAFLALYLLLNLAKHIICSAGFSTFYAALFFIAFNIFINNLIFSRRVMGSGN